MKDKDQTPKWKQIAREARDRKNELTKREVSKVINKVDHEFVLKLYDHRSEVIHRNFFLNQHFFQADVKSGRFEARFLCSDKLRKTFKSFGETRI
jgi:hypothetical protein